MTRPPPKEPDATFLAVRAKPRSSVSSFEEETPGSWVARLRASPVDGEANAELVGSVAKHFGCPRSAVTVVSGATSRTKRVRVVGVSPGAERRVMNEDRVRYHQALTPAEARICERLATEIDGALPEADNRIWHAHPVWFLDGNPVVGYSKLKGGIRLLFWSGQSFETPGLTPEGKFKAAEARYVDVDQVDMVALRAWLWECRVIQWDYKNIVRRKGRLERLGTGGS